MYVYFDSLCMLFSYGKFLVESLGTHLLGERQISNLLWLQKYNASDFPKPNGSVKETMTFYLDGKAKAVSLLFK